MGRALDEATIAADRGDPGFGAIVTCGGEIIAVASSTEVTARNPLAHDGVAVVGQACHQLDRSRLDDCTFYGTAEPCPMCSAALLQSHIGRIVIGASGMELASLLGPRSISLEDLGGDYQYRPVVDRGLRADESIAVITRSLRSQA